MPEEIAGWDIDIRPDGHGLPLGRGTVKQGEEISVAPCAACHDDLYAITAYVSYLNDIVKDENFALNAATLKNIKLPNEANFYDDDREQAEKSLWRRDPCMSDCLPGQAKVTGRARLLDVTPEPGAGPTVD
jgi:S-disulfanyl-L-cysteine oxidoreductase SoxD